MSEANLATVRRWFEEVWNQKRGETIDELLDDESICYGDGVSLRGRSEFRQQQFEPLINAFPDLHSSIESMICQGDVVVVRWSGIGHHTGGGLGIPPTGQEVRLCGMTWITVRDGKLAEGFQHSNIRDVLTQLAQPADAPLGRPAMAKMPF